MLTMIPRRLCALCALLLLTLGLQAASPAPSHRSAKPISGTVAPTASTPAALPDNVTPLVAATNEFGFRLLTAFGRKGDTQNLLLSPLSLEMALGMTYNGARGETRAAIGKALGVEKMPPATVSAANAQMLGLLHAADSAVTLEIANSLWSSDKAPLNADFRARTARDYDAEVQAVNFGDPGAAKQINSWISNHTGKKIDRLIEKTDAGDILYLVNALYFKGSWQTAFNKKLTATHPFTLPNGKKLPVPMMAATGKFRYQENETFQAIQLPYGKGRFSLLIFLPNADVTLDDIRHALTAANWHRWMLAFKEDQGILRLPRFSARYTGELQQPLTALGMGVAFSGNADFGDMFQKPEGANISDVLHGVALTVDEEGTTAAAATVVKMSKSIHHGPHLAFEMLVDHPFFCAIRDDKTGAVLFLGTIVNPGG